MLDGEYGLRGLSLSVPSIVGKDGVERVLNIPLNGREIEQLEKSAAQMKQVISHIGL